MVSRNNVGLYIHVPFCRSKCHYCDFYSIPLTEQGVASYISGVMEEVKLLEEMVPAAFLAPTTLYLGGGTPSILAIHQLTELIEGVKQRFNLDLVQESTLEVNPGTATKDKLKAYSQLGINRLSIGVQSFIPEELSAMGRTHEIREVNQLLDWLIELGMTNYSLDLIYGLPQQSLASWEYNLSQAIQANPQHISLYGLKLEESTPWGELYHGNQLTVPDDDSQADMYLMATTMLTEAGFQCYEISNFAKPGFASRHNLSYWHNKPYFGLGPGASSHYQDKRWTNVRDIQLYQQLLDKHQLPILEGEKLDHATREAETIILGLRLSAGVELAELNQEFNIDFLTKYSRTLEKLIKANLIEVTQTRVKLTFTGRLLANQVFTEFLP